MVPTQVSHSPLVAFFCVLTLNEPLFLHSVQPWLQLVVSGLSAISLTLIIAVNYRKLFSASVQKSNLEQD